MAKKEKAKINFNEIDENTENTTSNGDIKEGEVKEEVKEAVAAPKEKYAYEFAHKNKYQYIPAPNNRYSAIQFEKGRFFTNDKFIADYLMRFDGVICLSDNMEE